MQAEHVYIPLVAIICIFFYKCDGNIESIMTLDQLGKIDRFLPTEVLYKGEAPKYILKVITSNKCILV